MEAKAMSDSKICRECKEEKTISCFSKHKTSLMGVRSKCKPCLQIEAQKYKNKDPEKVRQSKRDWRERNRSQAIEASRNWTAKNPEKARAAISRWQESNSERVAANQKKWAAENRDRRNSSERNRRALKLSAGGEHTYSDIQKILEAQQGVCKYCASLLVMSGPGKYHVDHIMPLALGGSNGPENLQALCPDCNLRKSAKHPERWLSEIRSASF